MIGAQRGEKLALLEERCQPSGNEPEARRAGTKRRKAGVGCMVLAHRLKLRYQQRGLGGSLPRIAYAIR